MSFFTRLSIGRRLTLVLGAILLLCVASSLYAIVKLRHLGNEIDTMVQVNLKIERAATDWLRTTTAGTTRASAIVRTGDNGLAAYFAAATVKSNELVAELQKVIGPLLTTPEERGIYAAALAKRKASGEARKAAELARQAGEPEAALKLLNEKYDQASAAYLDSVREIAAMERRNFDQTIDSLQATRVQTMNLLSVAATLSVLVGALLAWQLTTSITRPLAQAEQAARAIANLDLSAASGRQYSGDEVGRLLQAIDTMRSALQGSLGEVRHVVDSISTASAEIATGNHDLSTRTEHTASNLQQTASSMEELTSTVRQSADSARQANQLTSAAAAVAHKGGEVIAQVVSTMDDINTSSKRIADIIGVIDGIAFQTNILALNAAVEAARAGEQGRGFAVVASEVRSLAGRSAEAAREIKRLIGESVERVESGSSLVKSAGATMAEIVGSVQRVSDIVGEISHAAGEQSQGIGQVNSAVTQLDQMTQQNAALVEQSAAAASSLQDQAQRLAGAVAAFKLPAQA
jgi:methyl-accepting chemotaxis protein